MNLVPLCLKLLPSGFPQIVALLDDHYDVRAVPFLRVLHSLVRAILTWHPLSPNQVRGRTAFAVTWCAMVCLACDFLADFFEDFPNTLRFSCRKLRQKF